MDFVYLYGFCIPLDFNNSVILQEALNEISRGGLDVVPQS